MSIEGFVGLLKNKDKLLLSFTRLDLPPCMFLTPMIRQGACYFGTEKKNFELNYMNISTLK